MQERPINFSPEELENYKKYIKKLTMAISQKLDILTPLNFMWNFSDEKTKKWAMMAVILEEKRIYYILNKVAPQLPDMQKDIAILNSVDGHNLVKEALATIEDKITKTKMVITKKEAAAMAAELESKLGFQIPEQ